MEFKRKTLSPPAMAVGFARPFCSIPGASSAIDANLKPTSTKMLLEIVLDGIFVLYVYGYGMLYPWNRFSLQKLMWDLWIHTLDKNWIIIVIRQELSPVTCKPA
jgi:hypothetical protein